MRTSVFSAVVLSVILATAGGVLAQGRPGMPPGGPDPALRPTPAQQRKMLELRVATARRVAGPEAELRVKGAELELLWAVDKPERGAILRKEAEMDTLRAKVREAFIDARLQMHQLLTPAQRAAFGAHGPGMMGGHGPGMMGGRGPGKGMGGPGMHGPGMGMGMGGPGMGHGGGCACGGPGMGGGGFGPGLPPPPASPTPTTP